MSRLAVKNIPNLWILRLEKQTWTGDAAVIARRSTGVTSGGVISRFLQNISHSDWQSELSMLFYFGRITVSKQENCGFLSDAVHTGMKAKQ